MVEDIKKFEREFPGTFFRLEKQDYEDLIHFSGMKPSQIAKNLCKYFLQLCRENGKSKKEVKDLKIFRSVKNILELNKPSGRPKGTLNKIQKIKNEN